MSRRPGIVGLLAAIAAVAAPTGATADSPKWGTVDVSVVGYRPAIDSEFTGPVKPWADIFGDTRRPFVKGLVSYTLLDKFVQLDAGLGTGWFRARAKGLLDSGFPSGDDTTFTVLPVTAALTVRVDGFFERFRIPVELYGRAALQRYHWVVTDGSGDVTMQGATNGWSVAGGVGFLLDFIDPTLGRELDEDAGVNGTWLFVEVGKDWVDDFGSGTSWILSNDGVSLSGGLRFVF